MGNLTAIIAADTTGFKKSVEEAKRVLNKFNDAEDEAAKRLKEVNHISDSQVAAFLRVQKTLQKVSSGAMSTALAEKALSNQVKELKIQYANLSDQAKNSEFGKALQQLCLKAESYLKQLQQQLKAVGDETDKTKEDSNRFGNALELLKGSLGKVAIAVGVATTAQEGLERVIRGSQQTSDAFDSTMQAVNTTVDNFFSAISSGDFSVFDRGLSNLISRAREAYAAFDQLANFKMSYNIVNAKANAQLAEFRAVLYDPDATEKQKKEAQEGIDKVYQSLKESVELGIADYQDAIIKGVQSTANIDLSDEGALSMIDKWLEMDARKGRGKAKEYAEQQYREYLDAVNKLNYETGNAVTATGMYRTNTSGNETERDNTTYADSMKALNEQYRDAIVYNELLKKYSDDELNALGQQRVEMINLNAEANRFSSTMNKLGNKLGGGDKEAKTKLQNLKDSLKKLEKQRENIDIKAPDADKLIADINQQIRDKQDEIINTEIALGIKVVEAQGEPLDVWDLVNTTTDLIKNGKLVIPATIEIEDYEGEEGEAAIVQNLLLISKSKSKSKSKVEKNYSEGYKGIKLMVMAAQELDTVWNGLFKNWEEMDFGEKFFSITNAIFTTIDAVSLLSEGIGKLKDMINTFKAVSSAASKQKIAENAAETASEHTKTAAEVGSAAGGIFSAHSSIPWVGVAIAIGLIGAMMAVMSQFHNGGIVGKFAGGGMIQGSTSLGDMNLARVNSGEMILNGSQQSHLFNLLNSSGGYSTPGTGGEVHFRIQGEDLVGVLLTHNRRNNKVL